VTHNPTFIKSVENAIMVIRWFFSFQSFALVTCLALTPAAPSLWEIRSNRQTLMDHLCAASDLITASHRLDGIHQTAGRDEVNANPDRFSLDQSSMQDHMACFAGVVIHAGHEQQRQASLPSSVVRLRVTDIPATLPPIPAKAVRPCVA
jgi:hypothetical protein